MQGMDNTTTRDINTLLAAIITTLAEVNGSPESMLYLGIGMDMDLWTKIRSMLVGAGIIRVQGHYVTLTDKGRELAGQINAAIAR